MVIRQFAFLTSFHATTCIAIYKWPTQKCIPGCGFVWQRGTRHCRMFLMLFWVWHSVSDWAVQHGNEARYVMSWCSWGCRMAISSLLVILSMSSFYIDINECNTNNGGCAQECTNTQGSRVCSCNSGFTLVSDGRNCTGTDITTVLILTLTLFITAVLPFYSCQYLYSIQI